MKLFIVMLLMNYHKIKTITRLNFELGSNYEIEKKNITILEKKPEKLGDCALIPLKDLPRHKPLW